MATQITAWKTNKGEIVASETQANLCDLAADYVEAQIVLAQAKEALLKVLDIGHLCVGLPEDEKPHWPPLGNQLIDAAKTLTTAEIACTRAYRAYSTLANKVDFSKGYEVFRPETECPHWPIPAHRCNHKL